MDITERKKTEDALRVNEQKYRELFENANDVLYTLDLSGRFTSLNRAGEQITGYTRAEVLQMNIADVIAPKDVARVRERIAKNIKGAGLPNFELEIIAKDDRTVTLDISSRLILQDGVPVGIQGIGRDITRRKQAEKKLQESEMRCRGLFESNPNPIWVYDADTLEFLDVNEEAVRHYGYSREEFLQLTIKELRPPEDLSILNEQLAQANAGVVKFCSVRQQKKDGTTIEVEVVLQPINFNGRRARFAMLTDVTERERAEEELQESERCYRMLFDSNPNPVIVFDLETLQFLAVNKEAMSFYGYSHEEFLQITLNDIRPLENISEMLEKVAVCLIAQDKLTHSTRHKKKDGTIIEVEIAAHAVTFSGRPARLVLITDVTERKRADAALRESEYTLRTLLASMNEGLLQVDEKDSIVFVNNCFSEMVGYLQEELIGKNWSRLLLDNEADEFIREVNERRRKGISDRYELYLKKKSGETLYVLVGGVPIFNAEGTIIGSMGVFTDITERKRIEEQLQHDAFHDNLTGLANRALFMNHLRMAIERGKSRHSNPYAVLFLDFDRFKVVNDSLGHAEGDKLLKFVAQRFESATRTGDLVARLGGDEFAILLSEMPGAEDAVLIAERIQASLKNPFDLSGNEVFISASIGIALSASGHKRAEDMLHDADIAMYRAKAKGKARYQIFDQAMHEHASKQLQLETEMRRALENEDFQLHYQPILNLETETLIGFEALVRWMHPERGMIPPFEFVPAAEENNLIFPLGQWILEESCRQMHRWQAEHPAAANLSISVNLSSKQFLQSDLAEQIAAALKKTGLDPRCLKLEITESHIMENSEMAVTMINKLRAIGVELSLDDFGTGYSSLSYLHRLPVDYLKIDRSFVSRMIDSEENSEIVHTIVKLARNLKMRVVAEGIETSEQLAHLKNLKCDFGQGYLFSKPLESEAAELFIEKSVKNPTFMSDQPIINAEFNM